MIIFSDEDNERESEKNSPKAGNKSKRAKSKMIGKDELKIYKWEDFINIGIEI